MAVLSFISDKFKWQTTIKSCRTDYINSKRIYNPLIQFTKIKLFFNIKNIEIFKK